MKRIIIGCCALLFAIVAIHTTPAWAQSKSALKTLLVGTMGPYSGPAASWGLHLLRGLEMKVQEINSTGGLKIGNDSH